MTVGRKASASALLAERKPEQLSETFLSVIQRCHPKAGFLLDSKGATGEVVVFPFGFISLSPCPRI